MSDRNPFRPPSSELDDRRSTLPPSPAAVRIAGYLVLFAFLFGLLTLLPAIRPPGPEEADLPVWAVLVVIAIFGGVTLWLVLLTQRGINWARWALLAYLGLGWFIGVPEVLDDFSRSPLAGMIGSLCLLAEGVGAALLFVGSASRWYREVAALVRART